MNALTPFHGVTLATAGRPDIRALVKHYAAPYSAADEFADVIEVVRRNSTPARRSHNQRSSSAIEIRKAVAGRIDAVSDGRDRLSVVMLAPDEPDLRQIIGAMFAAFQAQPTPTSEYFVDALVLELMEPDVGRPYSLPAIAAAARECWQSLASPPAISTFLGIVRQHQRRLDGIFQSLCEIVSASEWAAEESVKKPPPVRYEDDPNHIPF